MFALDEQPARAWGILSAMKKSVRRLRTTRPRLGSTLEPVGFCAVCFLLACRFRQGSTAGLNRESERFTVLVAHRVDELDFGVFFMTDSRPQMSKVGVGPAENLQPAALLLGIDIRFSCSIQYY